MTDTTNEFEVLNVAPAAAARIAYEIIDGKDPFTRHVVALDVENGLTVQTIDEEATQPFPRRAKGDRTVSEVTP